MKQDITKKTFCSNLFKDDTVVIDFEDYCCCNLESEYTLAIEIRKQFTEAATEKSSSNLCLAAFRNVFHLKLKVQFPISIF